MNDREVEIDSARRQRIRSRRMGEPLVENSSLRDALDDEQANRLLNWGFAQIEREVARTVDMSDAEAMPLLEKRVDLIRKIMSQVNELVDRLPRASESESWTELLSLSQRLRRLQPTLEERTETARDAFALIKVREELDRDATFNYLMAILQRDESV